MLRFASIILVVISLSTAAQSVENPDFNRVLQEKLKHDVPEIDVNTLKAMENYILLDARSWDEYNVSHLKGAQHVDFIHFNLDSIKGLDKKAVIVVYCSVGSRSEKVTKILFEAGYGQAFNLYGGIFEWSNQNLPMVDENGNPTEKVHGVNPEWAQWINNGEVVME